MKDLNRHLVIEQLDRKLRNYAVIKDIEVPAKGWIHALRTAINMSQKQLGARLGITKQSVQEIEAREADSKITLEKLKEVAEALNLNLVYGFVPKDGSLEKMLENRAQEIARKIVLKTSHNMLLEEQEISPERKTKALEDRARKIVDEIPRYLWD
jgi:predicted DNA-binding mobile mystery protein A